jgi:hypothetical protein
MGLGRVKRQRREAGLRLVKRMLKRIHDGEVVLSMWWSQLMNE